ncbi:MAG: UV DNA damage repair endonuclease UvsE [Bacillota bacterium]
MAIGYACIAVGVPNSSMSRCNLKNADSASLDKIIRANLAALATLVAYNSLNNIRLFRISSDVIPFATHPVNTIDWQNEYRPLLQQLGKQIAAAAMRVSMHPGQYTVLNSPHPEVRDRAVADLQYHTAFLDALDVDCRGKIILHIGGVYGDKFTATQTFVERYRLLPDAVKRRLVIENDDKNYSIAEVLEISHSAKIPVVFDNLHHQLNPPVEQRSQSEWICACQATWQARDGKQKIHYSQQKTDSRPGAHSDTIDVSQFQTFWQQLKDPDIDIMLEVKDKNLSALKCRAFNAAEFKG